MISKEHKKHTDIARPSYGTFGRNEWAFVGGKCHDIKQLANDVIKGLSAKYKCAYADAQHHHSDDDVLSSQPESGAALMYTNHINYQQFDFAKEFDHFGYRQLFNDADIVLVNGNHFEAKKQVIIIDETKKASLEKRLAQLTDVELILLANNSTEAFDFIKNNIEGYSDLLVYRLDENERIVQFFKDKMEAATPVVNGLVLAGGRSVRMGHDKGLIEWHGKAQQYYLADILEGICNDVYISCRADQKIAVEYKKLTDTFINLGPFGAILSAFREKPNDAWMVIACDLPLLDVAALSYLTEHRKISSMATSFESPYNHFPEPLVAIWEPKSYPKLLSFLSQGYNCPGKALRNMDTHVIQIDDAAKLANVNTIEEFETMRLQLQNHLSNQDAG